MTRGPSKGTRLVQWVLILTALALLIFLIRSRNPEERDPPAITAPLRRGEAFRVSRIERFGGPVDLLLERQDGRWKLLEPLEDLAHARMVRELLRLLEGPQVRRVLETDDPAPYGLEVPRYRMALHTREGRQIQFLLGDKAPGSGEVYSRWTGLDGIALVPQYVASRFFDSDLLFWRERDILPPARSPIDSVEAIWPSERIKIRRLGQDAWVLLEPRDREADALACERAVAVSWRFPIIGFHDDPAGWPGLGLNPPRATWVISRGDQVDTLRVGRRLEDGTMAIQLAGRAPGVVRDDLFDLLTGGIGQLEVRQFVRGDARDQRLVTLSAEGAGRCYLLRSGRWCVRGLEPGEQRQVDLGVRPDTSSGEWIPAADPALAGDLQNLFSLRGDAWVDHPPGPLGVGWSTFRLRIWDRDNHAQWVLFRAAHQTPAEAAIDALDPPAEPQTTAGSARFVGMALGSRFPTRPMRISSALVLRWQLRLHRPLPLPR